jgi:uncharacterized membrane protein
MFVITVVILLQVLPGPHKSTDYLVIGTVATLVCLLIVFLIVASTNASSRNKFFKQRK